jgi:hypothetical protein
MSFDCITEGSKDYIKYVLQLTEESMTGVTFVAPGIKKKSSFKFSGGAGGKGLGGKPREDTIKPGDFLFDTKDKKRKKQDIGLIGPIMWGISEIPGTVVKKGEDQSAENPTQGGLDYLTSLGQAQSSLEFADQMMPAAVKLLIAKGLYGSKIKAKPDSTGSITQAFEKGLAGATGSEKAAASPFADMAKDTLKTIESMTGVGGSEGIASKGNPLAQKVMQYSKNLGAIDPFNPLLGLKIGVEMLGGKEVLRRTRELGAAQSAGAASTMGHPSGFRGY